MATTAGIRTILFGIAIILVSGFVLIHDQLRYGVRYGPATGVFKIGLGVGLFICLLGVLRGSSAAHNESDT